MTKLIEKSVSIWNSGLKVQVPVLGVYTALAFLYAFFNPSAAFSLLLLLAAIPLGFITNFGKLAKFIWALIVIGLLIPLVGTQSMYFMDVATQVGMYVVLALGLNITVGYTGLFNLGYIAFYALGAYSYAIFCSPQVTNFISADWLPFGGEWFWPFLVIALGITVGIGILLGLPVIRVRGDYLCIVTLGFCEIIRNLLNNMIAPINITNGAKGIANIPKPVLFGVTLTNINYMYFIVLAVIGLVIVVCTRLENSKLGRAWTAIREDEIAARAVGVPIVKTKLLSFAISSGFAGIMGVIFAAKQGFVSPESFTIQNSFMILAMVILGGIGNIPGAMVGATLVSILNLQVLKSFSEVLSLWRTHGVLNIPEQLDPSKLEKFFFGLILILMMIFRPGGILPTRKKPITLADALGEGEAVPQSPDGGSPDQDGEVRT